MPEIIKVYREAAPQSRLTGIRYTDSDRENGSYAARWGEWFAHGRFGLLEALGPVEGSYLGAMRMGPQGFEYWIGMLLPPEATPPEGFDSADLPAGEIGVVWLMGREDAGLYACHDECLAAMQAEGMIPAPDGWFFERYNCPRFTQPDENGEVILDYCAYLR